jgi:hypothetical protein
LNQDPPVSNPFEFAILSNAYDQVSATAKVLTSFKRSLGELRFGIAWAWVQGLMHLSRATIPPSAWSYFDFVSREMARTVEAAPDRLKYIDTVTIAEITAIETTFWHLHLMLSQSVITRTQALLDTWPDAGSQESAFIVTVIKDQTFWDVAEFASLVPLEPRMDDCVHPVELQARVVEDERHRHVRSEWNLRCLVEWRPKGRPQ